MPTLNIDGIGQVNVSDEFMKLSKAEQQKTVEDIAAQVRAKGVADDISNMGAGRAALTAVENIPSSAVNLAKNIAQPVMHPVQTAENLYDIAKGVLQKTGLVQGTDATKYVDAVGQFLAQRYGSLNSIKQTFVTDPVGMAADVSMFLSGGSSAAARLPGIAGRAGEIAGAVGRGIDPVNLAVGSAKAAGVAADAVTGSRMTVQAGAKQQIARAIARDQSTPEAMASAAQTAVRPNATLADVGGENVGGLVERVAQTPGAGRSILRPYLEAKQQQQLDRISTDLAQLTGSKRTALQATEQTMSQRATAAAPLYKAAYEAGDREIWSPKLEQLSSSPTVKAAMQGAVRVWQDNATADGLGAMNPTMVSGGGLIKFGKSVPAFPNIQFWDYTKRLLDDKARVALRAGQNQKARTLTQLAQQLRTELDKQVPEYKAARDAWAGPSSYLDAVDAGRGILSRNESAEEMTAQFNSLSQADRQGYREAAVSSVIGKMQADPAKLADLTKYLRSPAMRQKITAIMPNPQAAAAWNRRLDHEIKSSDLAIRSLGNSATARRIAEMEEARGIAGELVVGAFTGTPLTGMMRQVIGGGWKTTRDFLRRRVDEEVAKIVSSPTAARNLQAVLGPKKPLLPPLPYGASYGNIGKGAVRGAFQAGRLSNAGQQ